MTECLSALECVGQRGWEGDAWGRYSVALFECCLGGVRAHLLSFSQKVRVSAQQRGAFLSLIGPDSDRLDWCLLHRKLTGTVRVHPVCDGYPFPAGSGCEQAATCVGETLLGQSIRCAYVAPHWDRVEPSSVLAHEMTRRQRPICRLHQGSSSVPITE